MAHLTSSQPSRHPRCLGLFAGTAYPWQSSEDLPRSPCCFDDMPCSQTPGMPDTAAQLAIPDSVFWSS